MTNRTHLKGILAAALAAWRREMYPSGERLNERILHRKRRGEDFNRG